ncbi:MAG: PKD domain-containing protein [Bacteroidia bacterium]
MLFWITASPLFAHPHEQGSRYFIPNGGQWPEQVLAHIDFSGLRIFIERDGFTWLAVSPEDLAYVHEQRPKAYNMRFHAWKSSFSGSHFSGQPQYHQQAAHRVHYFIGQEPNLYGTHLVPATTMYFKDMYPGIDLRLDAHEGFKYEFIVHPGADPEQIRVGVQGVKIEKSKAGKLLYRSSVAELAEAKPLGWTLGAQADSVELAFRVNKNSWQFKTGKYNKNQKLVLDPALIASTYTGSQGDNWGFTATYGMDGSIYLGGVAFNPGYPTTLGAFQSAFQGQIDMSISKFTPDGTGLVYSTYLGGSQDDYAMSLVADSLGSLYILGKTQSANFPVSPAAYDNTLNGGMDLAIIRLHPNGGSLQGATYLGGSGDEAENKGNNQRWNLQALEFNYGDDSRGEILLDGAGNVLVVCNTASADFPVVNAVQPVFGGVQDGILVKLNPVLSTLLYSTYLGGAGMDAAYGVKSAGGDTVYVTGSSFSTTLLNGVTSGYNRVHNGGCDGFILRMRTSAGPILSGTYIGTAGYEQSYLLDTDLSGRVYVTGITTGNMPVLPAGVYHVPGGKHFVQRYNAALQTLELSTTLGVSGLNGPSISPTAMLVDICSKIYVSGWGGATNTGRNPFTSPMAQLPVTPDAFYGVSDGSDMYVMVLEEDAQSLLYATFFGGSMSNEHVDGGTCRFSKEGVIYHAVCAGCGGNSDFPTTPGAWSAVNNGNSGGRCNAAVFKIDLEYVNPVARFTTQYLDTTVCLNTPVLFQPTGTLQGIYSWDFGVPGAGSSLRAPTYTYTAVGSYQVRLIVSTCVGADTLLQTVVVEPLPDVQIQQIGPACLGDSVQLAASGGQNYLWQPDSTLSNDSSATARVLALSSRWYIVTVRDSRGCEATDSIFLEVISPQRVFAGQNADWCYGDTQTVVPAASSLFTAINWLPDAEISDPTQPSQQFAQLPARWVYVQLTDSFGCSYLDSIWLNPRVTVVANGGPDRFVCNDDSVTLTASGGTRYRWSTGDTTASIRVFTNSSRVVWVEAFLGNCKSLPDTVEIFYQPVEAAFLFSPDTGYAPQEIQFINTSVGMGITQFLWRFGDGNGSSLQNPRHIYRKPGAYPVELKVLNPITGCSDSVRYEFLFIDSVFILMPNAFTPNGDGVNDLFVGILRNFEQIEFTIFDRWGNAIFIARREDFAWDGRSKDEMMPPGLYPYVLTAIGKNGIEYYHSGQIHLIR